MIVDLRTKLDDLALALHITYSSLYNVPCNICSVVSMIIKVQDAGH